MADYRINMALWQVPTMVVNTHNDTENNVQRTLANTIANTLPHERVALLRKRVLKADAFFRTTPGPPKKRNVTVFAAPEYLFARSDSQHFITEDEKDQLVKSLQAVSKEFPEVVLFPGTIAWKKLADKSLGKKALTRRNLGKGVHSSKDIVFFEEAQEAAKKNGQPYYLARNTCYVMYKGELILKYDKRENGGETNRESDDTDVFFVQGDRDNVFKAAGLRFGLKICAEVGTSLRKPVDVQVVISASHPVFNMHMQLKPGGYCGHADALIKPSVTRYDNGQHVQVGASESRHGGGPITKNQAARRITHALSYKTNPELEPTATRYAEKITELRGRARYYRLDYTT